MRPDLEAEINNEVRMNGVIAKDFANSHLNVFIDMMKSANLSMNQRAAILSSGLVNDEEQVVVVAEHENRMWNDSLRMVLDLVKDESEKYQKPINDEGLNKLLKEKISSQSLNLQTVVKGVLESRIFSVVSVALAINASRYLTASNEELGDSTKDLFSLLEEIFLNPRAEQWRAMGSSGALIFLAVKDLGKRPIAGSVELILGYTNAALSRSDSILDPSDKDFLLAASAVVAGSVDIMESFSAIKNVETAVRQKISDLKDQLIAAKDYIVERLNPIHCHPNGADRLRGEQVQSHQQPA